jgi:hypothetical protein
MGEIAQQAIHVARHAPELLPGVISGKVKLKDRAEQTQRRSPAATAALAGLEHGAECENRSRPSAKRPPDVRWNYAGSSAAGLSASARITP